VKAITEELYGHSFSASSISAINRRLDDSLAQFTGRPLAEPFPYLILDARYERVREAGVIASQAVLIAIGIDWDGRPFGQGVPVPGAGAARPHSSAHAPRAQRVWGNSSRPPPDVGYWLRLLRPGAVAARRDIVGALHARQAPDHRHAAPGNGISRHNRLGQGDPSLIAARVRAGHQFGLFGQPSSFKSSGRRFGSRANILRAAFRCQSRRFL
jgi:hypothetical protein